MKDKVMNEKRVGKSLKRLVVFSFCIMLFLTVAGYMLTYVFATTFRRTTEDRMMEEVDDYRDRIVKQIQRNFQTLNTVAVFIGESGMYQQHSFDELLERADYQNDFLLFGFFDLQGEGVLSTDGKNQKYHLSDAQPELQTGIYKAFQGESNVSDAFFGDFSRKNVFVFSVPVYQDNEIAGALVASDDVEVFSDNLGDKNFFSGSGSVHLVDSSGDFIIREDGAFVKEDCESVLEEPYLSSEDADVVKEALKRSEEVEFSFRYDGISYQGLLEPLEINGWYLLCVNFNGNVNQNIYKIVYAIVAFFAAITAVFIFTVLYGYWAVRGNNRELERLAYIDELTGIYNIKRFTELAEEGIEKQKGYAIAVINVRQFKFINEIFGKEQADKLLRHIAGVLKESIWDGEYVCRESADFFYLFLRDTVRDSLQSRIQTMMERIADIEGQGDGNYRLVLRCGVDISVDGEELQYVMTHAMFALARTKENRQSALWFFNSELHEKEQEENDIERNAYKALKTGEFHLFLQPKVSLADNSLSGAEALARWIRKDGKMVYPGSFIPLFEKNGFCFELDMYMFEKVCQQLRQWIDSGYEPVPVSVNQSKLTFYKADYVKRLCRIVETYRIPASFIILEILESLSIDKEEELNQRLEELKAVGFRISMDDFGTGFTSLNTLAKLEIDELKLDRGFLMEATGSSGKNIRLILEQIIQLSKKLEISTVIEGVETESDDKFVKQIGCDNGQGYFYSRPVSAEVFTEKILTKSKKSACLFN